MPKNELKSIRKTIGASLSGMAGLLGLSADNGATRVREMESGRREIGGPIHNLLAYIHQGIPDEEGAMNITLPAFLLCSPMTGGLVDKVEYIFHTRHPRFLAAVIDHAVDGLDSYSGDGVDFINVFLWIDQPLGVTQPLLRRAFVELQSYSGDNN